MSRAQFEQFVTAVGGSRVSLQKILNGGTDPVQSLTSLQEEGRKLGYEFTPDDAVAWLAEAMRSGEAGELSDIALDAVAGGAIVPGGGLGSGGRTGSSSGGSSSSGGGGGSGGWTYKTVGGYSVTVTSTSVTVVGPGGETMTVSSQG